MAKVNHGKHVVQAWKEQLDKAAYDIDGQRVQARLEVIPQRRPSAKAQAMFFHRTQGGGRE